MQEEANQKTVGIVVEGGKFTGRMFLRACDKYTQHRRDKKHMRQTDPTKYKVNQPKQITVKQFMKEGEPVRKVKYEVIESGAKGYFSPSEQRIALNEGMSELQTLKTLIHETGHSLLHDKDGSKIEGLTDTEKKTRNSKEVEAESIAYTVCEYFGLDASDYSFGYIAGWISSLELKELKDSMETIRQTSSHIITGIEEQLKVQELERLATDLDQFGYDWDFYEYRDAVEDREANVSMILVDLKVCETKEYIGFLKGVLEESEDPEAQRTVKELLDRLDKLPKFEKPPDEKKSIKDRMAAAEIKKAAQGVKEHIKKASKDLVLV